jgi:hypothetical protein
MGKECSVSSGVPRKELAGQRLVQKGVVAWLWLRALHAHLQGRHSACFEETCAWQAELRQRHVLQQLGGPTPWEWVLDDNFFLL